MRTLSTFLFLAAFTVRAQTVPQTVRVSNETTPPGGMAQMKVLLTSPQPIMGGSVAVDMPFAPGTIDGISLFSSTGDVVGAATFNGSKLDVRFYSPNGTFGTNVDYPLMTFTLTVPPHALPGQVLPVSVNLSGLNMPVEFKPGSITVGGSVSVTNVVPGGGILTAGSTFRIEGIGFTPQTKVQLTGIKASAIRYVSPSSIEVTLKDTARLDGAGIQVSNPDKSSCTYYSYLRSIPQGASARPLLARAVPLFSINTALAAELATNAMPQLNADWFIGLAIQNSGFVPADVTLELHSAPGPVIHTASLTLPPGTRIARELSEYFGRGVPPGAVVRINATQPIQVLGLLANDTTGVVLPVLPAITTPGPQPPVPVDGAKGGGTL